MPDSEIKLTENWKDVPFEEIVNLYKSVNWTNYTDNIDNLKLALNNSSIVVLALSQNKVIGLIRSLTDGVSIHYLQDILVHAEFQRKGVGRRLFQRVLEKYKSVRTHMLLTDGEERQHIFYRSLGYKNTKELEKFQLNAFVKMSDVELS